MKGTTLLAARISLGLALLALGGAAITLLGPPRPAAEPPMTVAPLEVEFTAPTGQPHTLTITIANPADRPRRVIGLAEG